MKKINTTQIYQTVFLLIALVSLVRSLIHIFAPDGGAQSIAGIRLDNFGDAAATVIAMFGLWGISQLVIAIWYLVVYFRYRNLIVWMYLLIAIEYLARIALGGFKSIDTAHTPPGVIGNFLILPLSLIMLYFSANELWRKA